MTGPYVQVGEADFFWEANGRNQFPDAAAQVEAEVQKYKQVGDLALISEYFFMRSSAFSVTSCG